MGKRNRLLIAGCLVAAFLGGAVSNWALSPQVARADGQEQRIKELVKQFKRQRHYPNPSDQALYELGRKADRLQAMNELSRIGLGDEDAVDLFFDARNDPDMFVAGAAKVALMRIGPEHKGAVPALIRALRSNDDEARQAAATALGRIGVGAVAAVPDLVAALEDKTEDVRISAALALAKMSPEAKKAAVPTLIGMLSVPSKNSFPRAAAAKALGEIGAVAGEAVPALAGALKDNDKYVRAAAAEALGKFGPGAEPAVGDLGAALGDTYFGVGINAANALAAIGPRAQKAIPALIAALNDRVPVVQIGAAIALGKMGAASHDAVPFLVNVLNDKDATVRAAAAFALGKIGAASKVATAALAQALKDEDGLVRTAAARSLAEIEEADNQPDPFELIVHNMDIEALKKALDEGADPNARYKGGGLTLICRIVSHAGLWGDENLESETKAIEMVRLVLASGGKIDRSQYLLDDPALHGLSRLAEFLIESGVDPNWPANMQPDVTPLYFAIQNGHYDVEKVLLKHGAKPFDEKMTWQVRFVGAAGRGDRELVERCLAQGAQANEADAGGQTALVNAVRVRDLYMVTFLLSHGASPKVTSKEDHDSLFSHRSPLHAAVLAAILRVSSAERKGIQDISSLPSLKIIRLLLKYGAAVSSTADSQERTPLHYAAKYGCVPVADILIEAGAKVMPRDSMGKTPLDYAESGPMIKLLKAHGATER